MTNDQAVFLGVGILVGLMVAYGSWLLRETFRIHDKAVLGDEDDEEPQLLYEDDERESRDD
jgi:hypothetical protein